MGNKKRLFYKSQTVGIIWVSVSLIIIVAIGIFSSHRKDTAGQNDTVGTENIKILTSKEDSAYHQRYKTRSHRDIAAHRNRHDFRTDSTMYDNQTPAVRRQPLVVELNNADTTTLQLLHGIGPAYARRIVRYRERLGGFIDVGQLLEVYGFTPELLAHIAPSLTLDTSSIRRIDINSIGLKQLILHPYIEYYQARDIVNLRNRGVRFSSADDLRAVPSMADSTLARLLPYLSFDSCR